MRAAQFPAFGLRGLAQVILIAAVVSLATVATCPAQTLTTLYSFCSQANCTDGTLPRVPIAQGRDGSLYGMTQGGGLGSGTIFRLTSAGVYTVWPCP